MPFKGRREWRASMNRLTGGEIRGVIESALYVGADVIRAKASQSISAGSVSGKGHKPSKVGEPPNRDTGTLQAHLKVKRAGKLKYQVVSEAPYSKALEFGSSKAGARPFLRPARDASRKQIRDDVVKKLNRFLRKNRPR